MEYEQERARLFQWLSDMGISDTECGLYQLATPQLRRLAESMKASIAREHAKVWATHDGPRGLPIDDLID